jgi:hypothetical protein
MRIDCLSSLQTALREAGLDDQYSKIPTAILAQRLRPRPEPIERERPANPIQSRTQAGLSPVGVWLPLLAFALGLGIGAVLPNQFMNLHRQVPFSLMLFADPTRGSN